MKGLDKRLDYEELLMTLNFEDIKNLKEDLPKDLLEVKEKDKPDMENQWCDLLEELDFPFDEKERKKFWQDMIGKDADFFFKHLYMLEDAKGKLATSVGLWPGSHFDDKNRLRLHWMMTSSDYQSIGAARYVLSRAIKDYFKDHSQPLYLSTQAQSWPAIKLYLSLGFKPYLEKCNRFDKDTAIASWQKAEKEVKEIAGIDLFA